MDQNEQNVDPAAILRGIDEESRRVQSALAPDAQLMYLTWGVAWILAFGSFFAAFTPERDPLIPLWLAVTLTVASQVGAVTFSAIHGARRGSGSRGPAVVQGAVYGNTISVSLLLAGLLGWKLAASGAPPEAMLAFGVAMPCLVIGSLSLCAGGMWNDRTQLVTGGWILLAGLGSLIPPAPQVLLVGVAAGLGLIALAIFDRIRPNLVSGPIYRTRNE